MLQSEVFPYYRKCSRELTIQYEFMKSLFNDSYVDELCKKRGYVGESQRTLIESMELGYCEIADTDSLGEHRRELGLVSENDNFLLNGRFIIPIHDIAGDLISLVGYYDDWKKYITIATPYFSKELLFFNFKHAYELSWNHFNGLVFVVEGMFDCLSLRAIGLPVVATMGSDVSEFKGEFLRLFKKVVAIPDDDKTGRRALNRYSRGGWHLPSTATVIQFKGGTIRIGDEDLHCKDMDNFVSWYDEEDVKDILLSYATSKEEVEELRL